METFFACKSRNLLRIGVAWAHKCSNKNKKKQQASHRRRFRPVCSVRAVRSQPNDPGNCSEDLAALPGLTFCRQNIHHNCYRFALDSSEGVECLQQQQQQQKNKTPTENAAIEKVYTYRNAGLGKYEAL